MLTRTKAVWVIVTIAVAVSLLASFAGASQSMRDPKGDSHKGQPDLEKMTFDRTPHGRLRHIAFAYNTFATNKAPCLHIRTTHRNQDDYILCSDGKISNVSSHSQPGTAKVRRPTDTEIIYVFSKKEIGSPSRYRWKFSVDQFNACGGGPCDVAPDTGFVTTNL